ncbi:MAG: bifunctional biotin--[acetyl-CoA-carboxylase] synthetase/biotin operon repressor, partial [Planctomycetota bacterium]
MPNALTDEQLDLLIPIQTYEELDSTSLEARRDVESGELGDQARLYVAKRQTRGLGRFRRSWASPAGGLWCTLAWPVNLEPRLVLEGLGLRVGVAVVHTVEHTLAAHGVGAPVQLKWPNDVMVKGRKIA